MFKGEDKRDAPDILSLLKESRGKLSREALQTIRAEVNGQLEPSQPAEIKTYCTGLGSATKEACIDAGLKLVSVIRNSGGDVGGDVKDWLGDSFLTNSMSQEEKDNFAEFLAEVGKELRTATKMARMGVGMMIALELFIGYFDIVTDILVAKSYYDAGDIGTAQITAGFAVLAIVMQAACTFYQYAKKPWKEQFGHTLAALLGLAPIIEGASSWTGKEDSDLMLSGPVMYAVMKMTEIAFESIPECIIQMRSLLASTGNIQTIQIVGVISSIVSGAFIMTGKFARSEAMR